MPENDVRIRIVVNDAEASKRLQGFGQRLKEMGERVNFIGSRFTAMFTLPVVGGLALLGKAGSEAAKQVNDLQGEINAAIQAKDVDKVKALNEQMAALPENVRRNARAWNEMQAALKPANDELEKAKTVMLEALVPLVKELAPMLTDAARGVRDLATWFSNLPDGVQKTIISVVGFAALLGPVMVIVGNFMGMIGSAAQLLGLGGVGAGGAGLAGAASTAGISIGGIGAAIGSVLIPFGLFVAAILLADKIVKENIGSWEEAFNRAATAARQLLVLGNYFIGGNQAALNTMGAFGMTGNKANGGMALANRSYMVGENGPELLSQGASGGYVTPLGRGSRGGGGGNVTIVYSPTLSTASQDEIEKLGAMIQNATRRRP